MDAALQTIREDGLPAASARTIAARAGANQALIFYHFGTVTGLIEAASKEAVEQRLRAYQEAFAEVSSFTGLLDMGRELHERERRIGNVALMAQLMAGAQHDPALAAVVQHALAAWNAEVRTALHRLGGKSIISTFADLDGLAHVITAGFIGFELYEGIDPTNAGHALDALENLGELIEAADGLGPVATRALHARIRSRRRTR